MEAITLQSFEPFLANENNQHLINDGKYGVILVDSDGNEVITYITEEQFDEYYHTEINPETIGDLNGTYPWVKKM